MTTAAIGHNLPTAREWLGAVLHSGEVTRVGQHLALVIFHMVDEKGHAEASVRDLQHITGWGRQTIADHLGELKVFMAVQLGTGRAKSVFDLQCKITRAVNELRSVRELDANPIERTAPSVREPDATVREPDAKSAQKPDSVREMDATASVREPDAKSAPRACMESSLREDTPTLESKNPLGSPSADELAVQALEAGLRIKGGATAKSARARQRTKGELDGSGGVLFENGKLSVMNGAAAALLMDFPKINLAEVCDRAGPEVSKFSYPSTDDAMAVVRKWARIVDKDQPKRKKPTRYAL